MNTSTNQQTEFLLPKGGYAAFDAMSLRNLIIERLNDQGIFTDQNYIGSNLASIIDIVAYAFNTLVFYLSKTSSESMFSEAQLYENINRIVKLLDYKPIGYQTSTLSFQVTATNIQAQAGLDPTLLNIGFYTIPRYSYLTVAGVPFSFNEDISFALNQTGSTELSDLSNKKLLYQGIFRENPTYTATGDENEIVTINVSNAYIDHTNIHVYVYYNKEQRWVEYKEVPNLFMSQPSDEVFEKRLNSNVLYEILFGNNINGKRLTTGDLVAIYYLQSSAEDGVIGPRTMSNFNAIPTIYSTKRFAEILNDVEIETQNNFLIPSQFARLQFDNVAGSTLPTPIESADSIRKNAPANFRSQYRLVTQTDYETFIKTNYSNFITDVKVIDNWTYTSQYLKYFQDIHVKATAFQQILLNQILYADACNFNNVYVCAIPKAAKESTLKYLLPAQKEVILSNIKPLKSLTSEIVFLDPIFKAIDFGVPPVPKEEIDLDSVNNTVIEIIKTPNNNKTSQSILDSVLNVIKQFFNPTALSIGKMINYSLLQSTLLEIDGIDSIRTRNTLTNEFYGGVSFYIWNPNYPDLDKNIIVSNKNVNPFDVVYFNSLNTISERIKVVEK